jgi:hypothetical protein
MRGTPITDGGWHPLRLQDTARDLAAGARVLADAGEPPALAASVAGQLAELEDHARLPGR